MCLKDLRDEFIYDCECRHLAKGSVRNYKAATRFLLEYLELKQITELEDVRPRHIRDLMKEKQDAGSTSRYSRRNIDLVLVLTACLQSSAC